MNEIKANVRGDSGLSDSQLIRSQASFLRKHKDELDKLERCGKIEMQRRRYEAKARRPKGKKSLWKRIKSWFNVK
tara:strand:+ start:360 stop:584 length:225 start_codon:yes stop_codon:yes gene_type:complete